MAAAVEVVGALDVLVNNAGISGGRISPSEATADDMRTFYETNVFGPVRVLHAFIPLLENSDAPVVVNVSSGVGSLGLAADPHGPWREANYPVYASSKAALNMLTIRYAAAFPTMRINSVDPGFTATDFNRHRGTQTVEQGAKAIVRYALITGDGPTGGFLTQTAPNPGDVSTAHLGPFAAGAARKSPDARSRKGSAKTNGPASSLVRPPSASLIVRSLS